MPALSSRIICFTSETRVLTARGERFVKDLSAGDRVLTADRGLRPVRWIGNRTIDARKAHAPVQIPKQVLGASHDMLVSPEHRVLLNTRNLSSAASGTEILARAVDLVGTFGIARAACDSVTYYHLLFDQHELLFADGILSESFHPAFAGLDGVEDRAREDLFATRPELRSSLQSYGAPVRPYAKHPIQLVA